MRKIIKELAGWLVYIVIVVIIAWGFVTFVAQRTQVSGASMETTLSDGDQLIVDKISYQFREPERFEIIVFPYQYEAGTYYIKRIIGLPGETVQILDGSVYINGEKLEEHYGNEVMEEAGIAAEPVTLGVDEYFVLGDNRNQSEDSRFADMGNVKLEDIEGKVWAVLSPSDHRGLVK
jgi:signal peptidase I